MSDTQKVEKNVILTPIRHADVKGKELLYLKLQANGKEVLINVGDKTFTQCEALLIPRETSTVVNVLKPEAKGGKK